MVKLQKQSRQNPKLEQRGFKDSSIAHYLEYYLGQKKDANGNVMYYTPGKANWVEIGTALSDLDEARRKYFHDVNSIYSGYNRTETDRKFCELQKTTTKIKIATFFLHCKEHGLNPVSGSVCLRELPHSGSCGKLILPRSNPPKAVIASSTHMASRFQCRPPPFITT